jgi:hypothetical protein
VQFSAIENAAAVAGASPLSEELQRCLRVADMMVTGHALLRDRYSRRALMLDMLILIASAWLTAMAFVNPEIARVIAFPGMSSGLTIGLLAVCTFALSLVQLRVDWKQQADRHERAARAFATSKSEIATLLYGASVTDHEAEIALTRYRSIGETHVPIPESQFNKLKKKHLMKILISREISRNPASSIWVIRLRRWVADNIAVIRYPSSNDSS